MNRTMYHINGLRKAIPLYPFQVVPSLFCIYAVPKSVEMYLIYQAVRVKTITDTGLQIVTTLLEL